MPYQPVSAPIRFHFNYSFSLRQRKLLKTLIGQIFEDNRLMAGRIDYIFCTDAYLLEINRQFLQHDDLTDIITFDLSGSDSQVKGEIYISIDRVKENAVIFKVPFHTELQRVLYHGALHLCGFKDKTPDQVTEMRTAEASYLLLFDKEKQKLKG